MLSITQLSPTMSSSKRRVVGLKRFIEPTDDVCGFVWVLRLVHLFPSPPLPSPSRQLTLF
jgi:hypothetical protein